MNVLIVSMSVAPVACGIAERSVRLSRALADAGINATLLATDAGLERSERETVRSRLDRASLVLLRCVNERFYIPYPSRRNLCLLRRSVRSADVVLLLNHWTLLNALAYRHARRSGVPHVVVPAGSLRPFGRSRLAKNLYNAVVGRRLVASASAWIATTALESREFVSYGVSEAQVTVIPNGIDPWPSVQGRGRTVPPPVVDAPYLLFVGRLAPIKGPDLLIDAFERLAPAYPRLHLVVAGPDYGMWSSLRRRLHGSAIADRVLFTGYLEGAAKEAAYRHASLAVVPSRREVASIVALEAAAAGCPVLLTDTCGFPEVEEVGGGRVVAASVEGLEAGLRELLSHPDRLPEMGSRLGRYVLDRFGWDSLVLRYIRLFEHVLARRQEAGSVSAEAERVADREPAERT